MNGEIIHKVIKQDLYHQNVPNGIQVIERTLKCLWMDEQTHGQRIDSQKMDARLIVIFPESFGQGIKLFHGHMVGQPTERNTLKILLLKSFISRLKLRRNLFW